MKNRILDDERGNISLIFGLLAMMLVVVMGGAVDVTEMLRLHAAMQSGADAAAISAARYSGTDPAERTSRADNIYLANVSELSAPSIGTLTSAGTTWTYTASYPSPTIFLKIIGIGSVTLEASA